MCGIVMEPPRQIEKRSKEPVSRIEEDGIVTTVYLDNRPLGWVTQIRRGEFQSRTIRGQRINTNSKQVAINFLFEENQ